MTEQRGAGADARRAEEERRIAHEGTLARFAGRCARHPWRVVATWLGVYLDSTGGNRIDWNEIAEILEDAYRIVAPMHLVTLMESEKR